MKINDKIHQDTDNDFGRVSPIDIMDGFNRGSFLLPDEKLTPADRARRKACRDFQI